MTNRSFKAKLIGSEILRSIKERADRKTDVVAENLELTREKDLIIDKLQTRLIAVLEDGGDEKDRLIGGDPSSPAAKAAVITELFAATNDAMRAYRAAETRHRAPNSPFGGVLENHLQGLADIKQELDREQSSCPCVLL